MQHYANQRLFKNIEKNAHEAFEFCMRRGREKFQS